MKHALTFLFCVFALGCGDPVEPYVLRVVAEDGSAGGDPVIQNAVDEIRMVLTPNVASGNRFDPLEAMAIDDGAEIRVSAAGEFQLLLGRVWIDRNAYAQGTTFAVDLPLVGDQMNDPSVLDPSVRVTFERRGEVIAVGERPFLLWPLPPGGIDSIIVRCEMDKRDQCRNTDPMP